MGRGLGQEAGFYANGGNEGKMADWVEGSLRIQGSSEEVSADGQRENKAWPMVRLKWASSSIPAVLSHPRVTENEAVGPKDVAAATHWLPTLSPMTTDSFSVTECGHRKTGESASRDV